MLIDPTHIDAIANTIGPVMASDMKRRIAGLGLHGTYALMRSIASKTARLKKTQEPIGVAFNLLRHGIMIDKGAGRGYGGKRKNKRMGKGKRPARPWLWTTLDAYQDKVAEMVSEKIADDMTTLVEGNRIFIRNK